ncbi:M3 family oligoendopeptidase [Marininema halotolerans]|uniref:Oligoendopeptidase, pepF/M3 family n=1 Tax=Marininema halotolerans TaxID=1155944 RepID=A0A1I6RFH4_9BACL|nr:M3 family oligoendopeptidase [Marininema halotolerans]SFS63416.1 oligoendopeptidase, pepF/M3 family [Marininema halotolerans]
MAEQKQRYSMNWNLDEFFPGGSETPQFNQYIKTLEKDIAAFNGDLLRLTKKPSEDFNVWKAVLDQLQGLSQRLGEVGSYVNCLTAEDMKNTHAKMLRGRLAQMGADFSSSLTKLDQLFLEMSEAGWENLLQDARFSSISFPLAERRRRAADRLPADGESLVGDLAVDGYHAWGDLYSTIVSRMTIPFSQNGKVQQLSVGQAANKLSSADRKVRKQVFDQLNNAWEKEEDLFASTLNHLGGFRLNVYRHRGWDSVHKEPLEINRMSGETLRTMWEVIDRNKGMLLQYMDRKAKMIGVEKLAWYDVYAPISQNENQVGYQEAADFIIDQFNRFDPRMAAFANKAFQNRWIEAEDRPGKRPGGFCTNFPKSGQSRIFMTFAGSSSNVTTLAHELGHAYHQSVMDDLPQLAQRYAMNVAETASTFAESIVSDAAIREAKSDEVKVSLLEDKIQRSVAFFMDIQARFLFETRFYEERKKGLVSSARLKELMVEAEKEAFMDALSDYHPWYWASKLHFHITGVPFYNFPYTFGYLFSTGLYGRALHTGSDFADRYVDLLRDTGRMTTEDLAQKHLGVDLTQPTFWQEAVDVIHADIKQFLQLTN